MRIWQLITVQLIASLKSFYYLFSLILTTCSCFRTIFLDIYLGFFLFAAPGSSQLQNWSSLIIFPQLVNLVFPLIHNEGKFIPDSQRNAVTTMSLYPWLQRVLSLSVHMFLYCFRPWPYTLNLLSYCCVWLMKCCKNKNSYMKIYFHSIKTALYLIKYIFIISPCFS